MPPAPHNVAGAASLRPARPSACRTRRERVTNKIWVKSSTSLRRTEKFSQLITRSGFLVTRFALSAGNNQCATDGARILLPAM